MAVAGEGLGHTNASTFQQRVLTGPPPADGQDFSLVLGGPLYQLVRRAHLSGDALELVRRRVQSLADLNNSVQIIQEMRAIPISRMMVIELAVATLLPVAPLLLTMVSLEELLKKLLQVVL